MEKRQPPNETEIAFAITRSHQDSCDANQHTRLLDQWLLGLNGAAATASLTFSSTRVGTDQAATVMLMLSLAAFAIGAASGAIAMRSHSLALSKWLYFWQLRAGIRDQTPPNEGVIDDVQKQAGAYGYRHDCFYRAALVLYVIGCLLFGNSVIVVSLSLRA